MTLTVTVRTAGACSCGSRGWPARRGRF